MAVFALSAVVALLFASNRLVLNPKVDAPRHVDAVVTLGGGGARGERAVELLDAGHADEIVFASAFDAASMTWATRPCNAGLNDLRREPICFRPEPATTQGEVRAVVRIARDRGWDEIIVVASEDQISRARMLFDRCWDGRAFFVGGVVHPQELLRVPYELGATLKALTIKRGC